MKMPINEIEIAAQTLPMKEKTQAAVIRELVAQQAEHAELIEALQDAIERIEQALLHFNQQ
ncbi:hypothetical protein [Brucella rhizosphaerae]|uniref:Uncharacterized protein n=1 Tax=Brucella rhizosphaerae TaxID=571254 RepID=A0A256F9U3_9HYPH|nr:hypothetical protein [Brucella rhizosphaerae]OYR11201.1 hypothetical protein CEV32_1499 [Brucella rhizosphaerae]